MARAAAHLLPPHNKPFSSITSLQYWFAFSVCYQYSLILTLRHIQRSDEVLHLVLSSSEASFPINARQSGAAHAPNSLYDVGARLGSARGEASAAAAAVGRASLDGRVAAKQKSPKNPKWALGWRSKQGKSRRHHSSGEVTRSGGRMVRTGKILQQSFSFVLPLPSKTLLWISLAKQFF